MNSSVVKDKEKIMNNILIACGNEVEAIFIQTSIGRSFQSKIILSPQDLNGHLDQANLVLLDHEFTGGAGLDFLQEILSRSYLPVIMLTPKDDAGVAVEAMRVGAFNYTVKAGQYEKILGLSIREAIAKFNEQEKMKETIIELKQRIHELETRLAQSGSLPSSRKKTASSSFQGERPSIMEAIRKRFKQGEINLPTLSQIYVKFNELYRKDANQHEIADLLKQDMAISSKLISVSNSTYYRGISENKTVIQAISRLGMKTTRRYVEVISNRALYTIKNKKYSPMVETLWSHSLSCAYASQIVAETLALHLPEDPFTLGLLHDIGKLILLQIISELEMNKSLQGPVASGELVETLNANHSRFGAALLKRWNFAADYLHIALYHDELQQADPISKSLLVVHFANLLVKSLGFDYEQPKEIEPEKADSARLLNLTPENIEEMKPKLVEMMQELAGRLN